jgi:hypothetical protein
MKSSKSSIWAYLVVAVAGLFMGAFLFSLNPWMKDDLRSDSYAWFLDFSRSIFQPQSAYYAESILLPLLAKLVGASRTLFTYKFFCGILTISILPVTAVFAQRYFQNLFKTLLFIVLFGLSFQYLQFYILGFPDPLTILLLVLAVLQKRLAAMFALLVLAMLSHFSMAALSVIGLTGLIYFSPNASSHSAKKFSSIALVAILVGKVILLTWYYLFHYQLASRLGWALNKGYPFFLERYEANMAGFWLTPGIPFLVLYGLISVYFLMRRQFLFVAAAMFALALAYLALFWTVDGLRVFAVVISAAYGYLWISFIQSIAKKPNSKATNKGLL